MIEFETGRLSASDAEAVLNSLPGDITFVGKDDKIVYYNEPNERLFGRTKAILGTDVAGCHPSKRVPAVAEVLRGLRSGAKKQVEFWVNKEGRLIWIRYFAVRSPAGEYLGCLEFAQDITSVKEHVQAGGISG